MSSESLGGGFCFALPPSLGADSVRALARKFADVLYGAGFTTVVPLKSYELLEQALLGGEVDAAWGPPIVCARVEAAGGTVALRAIRYGATTYRSVLICRAHDDLKIDQLGRPGMRRPRAVWVDRWSMGGYILPRHHLREHGVDLEAAFESERLAGSYKQCFDEVLDGDADVTASFASRRGLGYVEMTGKHAFQLRTLAYTSECPNDGVILSPRLSRDRARALMEQLSELIAHPAKLEVVATMFDVDSFDRPPDGTYAPLLDLL